MQIAQPGAAEEELVRAPDSGPDGDFVGAGFATRNRNPFDILLGEVEGALWDVAEHCSSCGTS